MTSTILTPTPPPLRTPLQKNKKKQQQQQRKKKNISFILSTRRDKCEPPLTMFTGPPSPGDLFSDEMSRSAAVPEDQRAVAEDGDRCVRMARFPTRLLASWSPPGSLPEDDAPHRPGK